MKSLALASAPARRRLFRLRRTLRLTPMFGIMRALRRRGVQLETLDALEVFGHTGAMHTVDYAPHVASLEVWEIDPAFEPVLQRNLAGATINIVDSYEQIRCTKQRFSLVVVDSWTEPFGTHCEHFELFPDLFRVLQPSAILIINVMPEICSDDALDATHAERRRRFYQVRDPKHVPLQQMLAAYRALAEQHGYAMRWWFTKDRYLLGAWRKRALHKHLCYLVMGMKAL